MRDSRNTAILPTFATTQYLILNHLFWGFVLTENIMNPHYLCSLCLWICLLTNLFETPNSILAEHPWSFADRVAKIWVAQHTQPSWGSIRQWSAFLFQLSYHKQVSLPQLFSTIFFTFLCFLLVMLLLKWPQVQCWSAAKSLAQCRMC